MFDNTIDYLQNTLEAIKSGILATKEVLVSISNIISTVVDILGFIGFRVFILLMTTAFILWLLNLVSPINKKANYFVAIGLVIWIAITAKMPTQIVIVKYIIIIISPFIITYTINFSAKYSLKTYYLISNKINHLISKIDFNFLKNKNFLLKNGDNISLLITSDTPTIEEMKESKKFLSSVGYKVKIIEGEKIFLTDDNKKIIFSDELKYNQLIKSIKSKNINLMWFWSQSYVADRLLSRLNNTKMIKQNKLIIGKSYNSFILNFLQEKWNWKVVYGNDLKTFINNYYSIFKEGIKINDLLSKKNYELSLISDFKLDNGYILKGKIVGGDLSVLVNEIGTQNQLNFNKKILFIDGKIENKIILYEIISHLQNFIAYNKIIPKSIVFGNLFIQDNSSIYDTIKYFSDFLKNNKIEIPFFIIKNFDFIILNNTCYIEYKNETITLNLRS